MGSLLKDCCRSPWDLRFLIFIFEHYSVILTVKSRIMGKRFWFSIAILLFTQQLHAGFIKHGGFLRGTVQRENLKENGSKDERNVTHNRSKRWVANTIMAAAMLASLGTDIAVHFGGCKIFRKNLPAKEKTLKARQKTLESISLSLDRNYSQAYTLQKYLNRSAEEVSLVSLLMEQIDQNANNLSKILDKQLQSKLDATAWNYSIELAGNTSVNTFDDVSIKYDSPFSTIQGTVWRMKAFITWPAYLMLVKLAKYVQARTVSNFMVSNPGWFSRQSRKLASGIDGIKTWISKLKLVQSINKYISSLSAKTIARVKFAATTAMVVIYVALEGLLIKEVADDCERLKEKVDATIKKMGAEILKFNIFITNLTSTYNEMQQQYEILENQLLEHNFKIYIEELITIVNNSQSVSTDMQNAYQDLLSFKTDFIKTAGYQRKENLIVKLNQALNTISSTVHCFVTKLTYVGEMVELCRTGGKKDLLAAYTYVVSNAAPRCLTSGYLTKDQMMEIAANQTAESGHYSSCMLNNRNTVLLSCRRRLDGESTYQIATSLNVTTAEISNLLSKCPKAKVSTIVASNICALKYTNYDIASTIAKFNAYESALVEIAYNACAKLPLTTVERDFICARKFEGKSLTDVTNEFLVYSVGDVTAHYNQCVIPQEAQKNICLWKTLGVPYVHSTTYFDQFSKALVDEVYNACQSKDAFL